MDLYFLFVLWEGTESIYDPVNALFLCRCSEVMQVPFVLPCNKLLMDILACVILVHYTTQRVRPTTSSNVQQTAIVYSTESASVPSKHLSFKV